MQSPDTSKSRHPSLSWPKSDDNHILQDNCFIIQQIVNEAHFTAKKVVVTVYGTLQDFGRIIVTGTEVYRQDGRSHISELSSFCLFMQLFLR